MKDIIVKDSKTLYGCSQGHLELSIEELQVSLSTTVNAPGIANNDYSSL